MSGTQSKLILDELAKAWDGASSRTINWDGLKDLLAAAVGCSPDMFIPKRVSALNYDVRLNETLRYPDQIYPVLIGDDTAEPLTERQLEEFRSHVMTFFREGILVFQLKKNVTPTEFEVVRLTAPEHSPIIERLIDLVPIDCVDVVKSHQSIRAELRAVAKLQSSYSANGNDPAMKDRKARLESASTALSNRLNCRPSEPEVSVKANSGLGNQARVPYLRIFDPSRSPAGHIGLYVCAFVKGDGKELVISIQQGATEGSASNFKSKNKEELRLSSEALHRRLLENPKFKLVLERLGAVRAIELGDADGVVGPKAQSFSDADIASVTLSTESLPSDTELVSIISDFHRMATFLSPQVDSVANNQPPVSGVSLIASRIHWREERVQEVLDSLSDASPQVVLAGPPGTGKTYVSRLLASELLGVPGDTADPRISLVQFHPTFGYEDFVEGLRPVAANGMVTFDTVPGPIVKLSRAIAEDGQPRVLIIDELNRANIPRVFGELMYLLEYRDQKMDLMLQQDFSLPSGLFIIATMNTADKSTRVMDVALRRRFDFFQLDPDVEVLRGHYAGGAVNELGEELFDGFTKLNDRLAEDLDRHRLIGHSYFMSDHFGLMDLKARWNRQIEPLLHEYFFERQTQVDGYKIGEFWPSAAS